KRLPVPLACRSPAWNARHGTNVSVPAVNRAGQPSRWPAIRPKLAVPVGIGEVPLEASASPRRSEGEKAPAPRRDSSPNRSTPGETSGATPKKARPCAPAPRRRRGGASGDRRQVGTAYGGGGQGAGAGAVAVAGTGAVAVALA